MASCTLSKHCLGPCDLCEHRGSFFVLHPAYRELLPTRCANPFCHRNFSQGDTGFSNLDEEFYSGT